MTAAVSETKTELKKTIIVIFTIAIIMVAATGYDIYQDRCHSIELEKETDLLAEPFPIDYSNEKNRIIGHLEPNTDLKVLRIKYGKDYMAIKVQKTADGKVGYIISNDAVHLTKK